MDRNAPDALLDPYGSAGADAFEKWLECAESFEGVKPILTPRFIPACSDELLNGLRVLKEKYNLPVQSHLSENPSEVEWVKELHPQTDCYLDAYDRFGLVGSRTVMAHCVYPENDEKEMLKRKQVFVSHCPASNMNLASGIAPIREYLNEGIRVSLGTDIAGGYDLSMLRAIADAVQVSKLRSRFAGMRDAPLKLSEAFYIATMGGGSFFGNVGCFEKGYELDALVIDDSKLNQASKLTAAERLERSVYLEKDISIHSKYVKGKLIYTNPTTHGRA